MWKVQNTTQIFALLFSTNTIDLMGDMFCQNMKKTANRFLIPYPIPKLVGMKRSIYFHLYYLNVFLP